MGQKFTPASATINLIKSYLANKQPTKAFDEVCDTIDWWCRDGDFDDVEDLLNEIAHSNLPLDLKTSALINSKAYKPFLHKDARTSLLRSVLKETYYLKDIKKVALVIKHYR